MDNLTPIKNKKGKVFFKNFNKLLLEPYMVSYTDYIYDGNVNITENEKVAKEDINLFKPIEFSNSFSPNDDSNESINLSK